jgi:ABC-type Fe3+-hydroxamate transport system substrate-binding protein
MAEAFRDDMGRSVILARKPQRIVSLVPSETATLFALGAGDRVIGRTRYCDEPAAEVEDIVTVGGTKDPDVEKILSLQPQLVLANQEENSRSTLEELAQRGVPLFVSFPRRVADAASHVARLARILGVESEAKTLVKSCYEMASLDPPKSSMTVFVPIWADPLMTFNGQTFTSDLLRLAGFQNVFADRERKYPLKADLAERSPLAADQVALRDKRYPRIREEEIIERKPEWILLPSEPHPFGEKDRERFLRMDTPASAASRVLLVDGKDLFWPGPRMVAAFERLKGIAG